MRIAQDKPRGSTSGLNYLGTNQQAGYQQAGGPFFVASHKLSGQNLRGLTAQSIVFHYPGATGCSGVFFLSILTLGRGLDNIRG
ncbi:hypothetical protein ES703_65024 [subsurface metagenome]